MMRLLLLALAFLCLCGLVPALMGKRSRAGMAVGSWGAVLANLLGLAATVAILVQGRTLSLHAEWNAVPGASFSVGVDPLSGFFLLPIFGVSAVSALFGGEALGGRRGGGKIGVSWLFFDLLTASMAMVVLARNAVLFLAAWEIMSLSSWFLVTFEDEKEGVREAGITYLVASQMGTAFLLILFLLLGAKGSGTQTAEASTAVLDFSRFSGISGAAAGAAFLLALVGFGTKAGIVPLHVWLPEAHPAAPSHVSAVMSGVMIKMGIYGIVRVLLFLDSPAAWWGWTLLGFGVVSGILGVLFALAQHDVKRLLAYHSVENVGIICMGLGIGLLGLSYGSPVVAFLGFAGGLLHVVNHALFKSLLFLGAGAAAHAAGTRDLEKMGGLLKRMPLTGVSFLIGAVAICGLPPLNGFVSELLVYAGAFRSIGSSWIASAVAGGVTVAGLALIGGLAAACFAKAFGIAFLGEARSPQAAHAREAGPSMVTAVFLLAVCCLGIGLFGPLVLSWMTPLVAEVTRVSLQTGATLLAPWSGMLGKVTAASAVAVGVFTAFAGLRLALLSRRRVEKEVTWDCGYVKPDPRMQYTASSFAQPLLDMFKGILIPRVRGEGPAGFFPKEASFSSETPDVFEHRFFRPVFDRIGAFLGGLRRFQHGRLQLYVLYIAATLLILLIWRFA